MPCPDRGLGQLCTKDSFFTGYLKFGRWPYYTGEIRIKPWLWKVKVLSMCVWDVFFLSILYNPWLCNKKRYVLTTASLSELLAWKTGKETGEGLKPGDSSSGQEWRAPRSGRNWDEGMDKALFSTFATASKRDSYGRVIYSLLIHSSLRHFLSNLPPPPTTMYWKYIMVSSTLYVLSKCVLNEWNLEKQLVMS